MTAEEHRSCSPVGGRSRRSAPFRRRSWNRSLAWRKPAAAGRASVAAFAAEHGCRRSPGRPGERRFQAAPNNLCLNLPHTRFPWLAGLIHTLAADACIPCSAGSRRCNRSPGCSRWRSKSPGGRRRRGTGRYVPVPSDSDHSLGPILHNRICRNPICRWKPRLASRSLRGQIRRDRTRHPSEPPTYCAKSSWSG